jgi:glycosyltransferase involved in cell wall biosynthesis
MKLLSVIDTLGAGGKERRFTELMKALSHLALIEIKLVVMSNTIHYTEINDLGIETIRIIRKTRKDLSVFRQFKRLIVQEHPDAVHCWESMTAVYLAPVCRMTGCPLINGMVTNVPLKWRILNHHWLRARLTFPFSNVIVSNSQAGLKAYMVPRRKGVVIYNGFDFSRLDGIREIGDVRHELCITTEYVVGMVASFCKQKDYPTFYRAAQKLLARRRDITFLAIGSGTDSSASVSLVDESEREYFRFLGKRSGVESYVNAMDVCVLATFTEGISNSVIEYMALGKPVVATIGGGTEELVKSGSTGFLVRPSDPKMLADKIEMLIDDVVLRKQVGNMGRERIENHFSIDRMVNDYLNLYNRVINK